MKSAVVTILVLSIVWIICANGAASVYPNSLSDWYRNTMEGVSEHTTRMMQSFEQSETIGQSDIHISLPDGSLVKSRIINTDSSISDASETISVSSPTSVGIDIGNNGNINHKIIQVLPGSSLVVSPEGSEVMQVSQSEPNLQIYYGYQTDASHPFSYLYKVDTMYPGGICQTVRVDFGKHTMDLGNTECNRIIAITSGNEIPEWGSLP